MEKFLSAKATIHTFCRIKWYIKHTQANWYGTSAIMCTNIIHAMCTYLLMPIQWILHQCAYGKLNIVIPPRSTSEQVVVAIPVHLKYSTSYECTLASQLQNNNNYHTFMFNVFLRIVTILDCPFISDYAKTVVFFVFLPMLATIADYSLLHLHYIVLNLLHLYWQLYMCHFFNFSMDL